ncbi:Uncharacterised protein [Candidatus Venteria ishoeyi]|uniref:Uncharacterized protein n=2 Tax=Candidatus Venteria ishoeyi TaxID=1899563 RepID=A0A1H6FIE2_9GAMM|nr:Uncharacterised protein [Candidatus Venteria ishoeyi]
MHTIYRINADELNADFVDALKTLFRHKHIEIMVHETPVTDTKELEERRNLLAAETQEALALFRQGDLPAQSSNEVIKALQADLTES